MYSNWWMANIAASTVKQKRSEESDLETCMQKGDGRDGGL